MIDEGETRQSNNFLFDDESDFFNGLTSKISIFNNSSTVGLLLGSTDKHFKTTLLISIEVHAFKSGFPYIIFLIMLSFDVKSHGNVPVCILNNVTPNAHISALNGSKGLCLRTSGDKYGSDPEKKEERFFSSLI